MFKVAICDDDAIICEKIVEICQEIFAKHHINVSLFPFLSGEALLDSQHKFDLVVLDVEMPNQDGFIVAKKLRERDVIPYMIFLTAHKGRMEEAFYVRAFRYLLKPVKVEQLEQSLLAVVDEMAMYQKLIIEEADQQFILDIQNILYIESQGEGKIIHTKQQTYFCVRSFEWFTQILPMDRFMLIHKSFLVHLAAVRTVEGTIVQLSDGQQIPISRRQKKAFQEKLLQYVRTYAR